MPDFTNPNAPIWPIIRLVSIGFVAWIALSTFYSHGFDMQKDGSTITAVLTALGGIDGIKHWICSGNAASDPKSPMNS